MEIPVTDRRSGRRMRILVNLVSVTVTLVAAAFLVPSALGLERFVITGTSMTGTIDLGSVAFSEVVPVSELRVGDVITYTPPPGSGVEHLVTHRIIAIHGTTFRTQGDAVSQPDPWTFKLAGPVQPRVKFVVPYAGYAFIALADRSFRLVVIAVPAGLITLMSLVQLVGQLRRRPRADPAQASGQPSLPIGG